MTAKLLLSTTVWGEDYLEIFLEYTLKSLLTKENLKCKDISKKSELLIFTEKKYFKSINNHSNLKKLKKIIKVSFKELKFRKKNEKYTYLKDNQNLALIYGYQKKFDYFSFIYPDSVFGENHFKTILEKVKKGSKVILCPGPLGIYEKFVKIFRVQKINNKNLSNFILNNIHPFYKVFMDNDPKNRIKVYENREKEYQLYKCYDLHVAIISLSIKNLKIVSSFDEDLLNNSNILLKDLDYFTNSNQGIIITLESNFSERASLYTQLQYAPKLTNINEKIYDIIRFCDKKFLAFHINNFLKGTFLVSKKKSLKDITTISPFIIASLKKIMRKNDLEFSDKKNIVDQFLGHKLIHKSLKEDFSEKYASEMDSAVFKMLQKEKKQIESERRIFEGNLFSSRNRKSKMLLKIQEKIDIKNSILIIKKMNKLKFSILILISIIYRSLPMPVIKFIGIQSTIKKFQLIANEVSILRFLVMIPAKTAFKILSKRIK